MSEVKVNKISHKTACGTTTLGDSGDTFTLPSGATMTVASGGTITNSGTASGFGATGETSWDTTVKTTGTFTATAGVGYFLNTTGGIITVNLAAGTAGDSVAMADYAATWQTNNVTVSPNGSEKIGGVNADVTLSTEGQSVTFVYIDGTQGWVNVLDSTSNVRGALYVTATGGAAPTCGTVVCTNYKVHTFTGPGTFCVSCAGDTCGSNTVDYMVIAGGGSGGGANPNAAGGGGAGGYRESPGTASGCYTVSPRGVGPAVALPVSVQGYPIDVGGGAPAPSPTTAGTQGSNSVFSTITSTGGGGGAKSASAGSAGGSGGGGGGGGPYAGGAGDTPPAPVIQGMAGGTGGGSPPDRQAGGGGGATVAGTNAVPGAAGPGGAGATSSINATPTARAGGGGGGGSVDATCGGAGGAGNPGGAGGNSPAAGGAGTVNAGGGGGGGATINAGGAGGSGTVIIRYKFQ